MPEEALFLSGFACSVLASRVRTCINPRRGASRAQVKYEWSKPRTQSKGWMSVTDDPMMLVVVVLKDRIRCGAVVGEGNKVTRRFRMWEVMK